MKNQENQEAQFDKDRLEGIRKELLSLQQYLQDAAIRDIATQAYSIDGRTFSYEAPISSAVPVGSYVHLETGKGEDYLGQISTKEVIQREGAEISYELADQYKNIFPEWLNITETSSRLRIRVLEGSGELLGKIVGDSIVATSNKDTFPSATIKLAASNLVESFLVGSDHKKAALPIGQALYVDGVASVKLNAGGFNRHTFMCGQSGSGKTFSMGIVLEQILLNTNLRIVIIDPNSDFVRLNELRSLEQLNQFRSKALTEVAYNKLNQRFQQAITGLRVFRPAALSDTPNNILRVRFGDLSQKEQGTVLQLDPLHDREEYNTFWRLIDNLGHQDYSWGDVRAAIGSTLTSESRQLGLRIENLGIAEWDVWCAPGEPSLIETLAQDDWRCLVIDIGTLGSRMEKAVISNAVLDYFWQKRNQRQPILIVIDEAHNICPQDPFDEMQVISTDEVIRIAGEGRKYGIYLLLATQRPSKIHSNVLSQCDNLMLMRMNSISDLAHLSSVLSHIPSSLLEQATKFGLGETLLAGRIVKNPTFAKFDGRLSEEGGSDIPTSWATTASQ